MDRQESPRSNRTGYIVVSALVVFGVLMFTSDWWGSKLDHTTPVPTLPPLPSPTKAPPAPTARPVPTSAPAKQPIEILAITSKDAGLGDGTLYVYVDIVNNTSRLYQYVLLNGTCQDASKKVVGTGIGNTANLAAGERTTVTVLMLNVQGCASVSVAVDPLSQ